MDTSKLGAEIVQDEPGIHCHAGKHGGSREVDQWWDSVVTSKDDTAVDGNL